ncbi:matrixin family metalloprotease [bacterium]|nr:matrixin family metalloprotease [bacterium]
MRAFNFLILAAVAGAAFYFYTEAAKTPCEKTLYYSIGEFDGRFDITRDGFLSALKKAEAVWEDPAGLPLFEYDPEARFAVHLVYNESSAKTERLETLDEQIEKTTEEYAALKKQFESLEKIYEQSLAEHNEKVSLWNKKGGAPEDVYQKLTNEENDLERQRRALNELVDSLNSIAREANLDVEKYNQIGGKPFDQGNYTGDAIRIYSFEDEKNLVLVLAHEFGHALGIGHVEDPRSIMHYLMSEENSVRVSPSPEDLFALKAMCQ